VDQLDYRKLFESAAGLYVVFDRELRIVAASDAYLRATQRRREEIMGRTLFEAFPENPDAAESAHGVAREMYGRIFAGSPTETLNMKRYDLPLPGGGFSERHWDVISTPVPGADGTVHYAFSRLVDVTASEERYRSLFESIDAGFCVIEMIYDGSRNPVDYRFLETNPAFERQTGLKDAPAKTMREHVPEHERHWFEIYGRVAETGEPVRFVQPAKALMDGWYEVYAYRVGAAGSRQVAVLFNDISERVRAEESLREAARRKDEFLATLAHELRNPLAPIRTALAILRLKEGPADPELRAAQEIMERQVGHLVRLVDDLLDVSRITFGKIGLRCQMLDLRIVAEEAADAARAIAEESGHRLVVRVGTEPLRVDGDPVRLGQVVSNLLLNAVRYTPPGGEILLAAEVAADEAQLFVQDNGAGIERAQLEKIFEAFAQVTPAAGGGIGIGLTLSRKLVELHGGTLTAHSEGPGKGSRFVVRLPLARYPASTSAYAGVLSNT
jgi:PAS domain S-box-containing protein